MLIGIDASRALTAQRTGTENYSFYLIRALVQIGRSHHYRLYAHQEPPEGMRALGYQVTWRVMPFPRLWTHVRLAWEVLWHPPDVLFVPAHVLPWLHPVHCVVTVHDLGYLHYPEAHARWTRWYLDWSTRFNARVAQRIIADSNVTRDDLIACYGVDPAKIVVAYPAGAEGFGPVSDPEALKAVRQRYGTGSRYFLYVGTLQPRKNLATLIEAFISLMAEGAIGPEVKLVLAGKRGWLCDGILELARAPSLRDRVVLPGYVPTHDLPALLSGALAFILPSWYEGFGLPILEAMACDTPVICSDASALAEVAGEAAILIDPHDSTGLAWAMARVYRDPRLRRELIARGRKRLRAFSWQQCALKVLAALEAVGAEKARGRGIS